MRYRYRVLATGLLLATAGLPLLLDRSAFSDVSNAPGTEVTLKVEKLSPSPGHDSSLPQYRCTAKIQRSDTGEILAEPRIQALQGQQSSASTTTESGVKVGFQVLVSAPNQLTYQVQVLSPGAKTEFHRASIALPQ